MTAQHCEQQAFIPAPMDAVFAYLDDHTRLAGHMREPSWKMGGGRMDIQVDADRGQRVGSMIRLSGRVFGLRLSVEEVVTERDPPQGKVWETVGTPRFLVIGPYRMGFALSPLENACLLRVFIQYDLPRHGMARCLGHLLGRYYAAWCTERMVADAIRHFDAAR